MTDPAPGSENITEPPNFFQGHRDIVITVVAGTVFLLIGVGVTWVFFSASKEVRAPVFLLGARTEIVRAERVSEAPIRVVREDGTEITDDLTAIEFFFWNMGELLIRDDNRVSHVLTTTTIELLDPEGEIIDFRVVSVTRDVVAAELKRNPQDPLHALDLRFRILEQSDGVAGQIIFLGDPLARFSMAGDIEGVPGGIGSQTSFPTSGRELVWAAITSSRMFNVLLLAILFAVLWFVGLGGNRSRFRRNLFVFMSVVVVGVFIGLSINGTQSQLREDALERVPESLQLTE